MNTRSFCALILAVGLAISGFAGDAGTSQTASTTQSSAYRLEVPTHTGPSRRIAITKNGILLATLEIPSTVGLSVEPKEQSVEALQSAAAGPTLELATNSDIVLGPHEAEQRASIRIAGAAFAWRSALRGRTSIVAC